MTVELNAMLFAATLFIGILVCLEVGCRLAARKPEAGEVKGAGAIEGVVFALLGLLIAFTFSGAASRFEERRHLITQEANAIGTAWLRIDLLPQDAQPVMRSLFVQYLENRAAVYLGRDNHEKRPQRLAETSALQQTIWAAAIQATGRSDARNQAGMLFLPALNEMIDITTTRVVATRNHPPAIIFLMLGAMALVTAFLVGYAMGDRHSGARMHKFLFALIMSGTFFVIIDLEHPRAGLIRVDDADKPLQELLETVRQQQSSL